jgi:hypothetical protein
MSDHERNSHGRDVAAIKLMRRPTAFRGATAVVEQRTFGTPLGPEAMPGERKLWVADVQNAEGPAEQPTAAK